MDPQETNVEAGNNDEASECGLATSPPPGAQSQNDNDKKEKEGCCCCSCCNIA